MIPYARQTIEDEDVVAVSAVLRSDWLTQGPAIPAFESGVAELVGAKQGVAVSNGTAALHIACLALEVGPSSLVWTSPNSFVASANCARYCGAAVDFVDIDPRTYNMSAEALEKKLRAGGRPDVVVVVDFAGQPADLDAFNDLRERYGFKIIHDASHAVGARFRGRMLGGDGDADVTVFSFHPVKIVTTAEGGMAMTGSDEVATRLSLFRSHGITRETSLMEHPDSAEPWEYEQLDLGYNYRLTDLQAALGLAQLKRIERFLERRHQIASRYDTALASMPIVIPYQHPDAWSAYHLYPIRIKAESGLTRRQVYDALRARGIAANVHYIPIHTQPYYRRLGFAEGMFPEAEAYYREALSMPMYPGLSDSDQERVIEALGEILRR